VKSDEPLLTAKHKTQECGKTYVEHLAEEIKHTQVQTPYEYAEFDLFSISTTQV